MNTYIISACRTAVGKFGGSLAGIPAQQLGSAVIKAAVERAGLLPTDVDEVIMGNVLQAGLGQNPARQASLDAGMPVETPAMTINKVCGSGLQAVVTASQIIKAGDAECIVAGGMENMSRAPYACESLRWGNKMGPVNMKDIMINDGLWDAFNNYHMGITAENVAEKYGITREMQDEFSAASQKKTTAAIAAGKFKDEIIPISVPVKKGDPIVFDTDEFPRADTTVEVLAKLKPSFKKDGTVTAGNASGINDGAAALVIASEKFVKEHNIKPLAKILSNGSVGVDPSIMGMGPVPSSRQALEKAGLKTEDIDLFELNEAFASQSCAVVKELGLDASKVNINGGAISIGHPIGASGARILVTLIYDLIHENKRLGLASLCIGGGMGEALIIEKM